jgi:hypothetical protein
MFAAWMCIASATAMAQEGEEFRVIPLDDSIVLTPTNCLDINPSSPSCFDYPAHTLPKTVEEFLALRDEIMSNPDERTKAYGGASLFLYALLTQTFDRALGDKFLVITLTRDNLDKWQRKPWSGSEVDYKGYTWNRASSFHVTRILERPYLPKSHIKGTLATERYETDLTQPITLVYRKQNKFNQDPASGKYKVFSCTSGAATCRPITLLRNNRGIWKVDEFSTLSVDIAVGAPKTDESLDDDI